KERTKMMNAILIFGTRYTEISICSAYMNKKVSPHEYNPAINKGLIYMKIINNSIGKLNCRLMYTAPRTNNNNLTRGSNTRFIIQYLLFQNVFSSYFVQINHQ